MLRELSNKWVSSTNKKDGGREWPYYSGKEHRIIIEKLLVNPSKKNEGIQDYKIYCFNWNYVSFAAVIHERFKLVFVDERIRKAGLFISFYGQI